MLSPHAAGKFLICPPLPNAKLRQALCGSIGLGTLPFSPKPTELLPHGQIGPGTPSCPCSQVRAGLGEVIARCADLVWATPLPLCGHIWPWPAGPLPCGCIAFSLAPPDDLIRVGPLPPPRLWPDQSWSGPRPCLPHALDRAYTPNPAWAPPTQPLGEKGLDHCSQLFCNITNWPQYPVGAWSLPMAIECVSAFHRFMWCSYQVPL